MTNIYAVVIGSDDTLMVPLVSAILRVILGAKVSEEKCESCIAVAPTVREKGNLSEHKNTRVASYLAGLFDQDVAVDLIENQIRKKSCILSEISNTSPSLIIATDGIKGDGAYNLFEDSTEATRSLQMNVFDSAMLIVKSIYDDLKRLVDVSWSRILEESQEENEPEYKPMMPSGSVETMKGLIEQIDLNYQPDIEAFPSALKSALLDLFGTKPENEWHEWLMSCLIVGMQAKLPEVATMWELRKSLSKPSK